MPHSTLPLTSAILRHHKDMTCEYIETDFSKGTEESASCISRYARTSRRFITALSEDSFFIEEFHRIDLRSYPSDCQAENHVVAPSSPVFNLSVVFEGCYSISSSASENGTEINPDISQFSHATFRNFERIGSSESSLHVCNISIPVDRLREWLGTAETDSILSTLSITSLNSTNGFRVPRSISNILKCGVDYRLSEKLKALQLQARLFDYFVALSNYLNSTIISSAHRISTLSRARAVHDYLLTTEGKTPTLVMLASRFGASPSTLNKEFMAHYQQSIFTFLMNYRLEQARLAIEASSQPIKKIAYLSGYSHVSHFTAAFRRKFGCTPGSLRNLKYAQTNQSLSHHKL